MTDSPDTLDKLDTFENAPLSPELKRTLDAMEFSTPTPIQAKAIPLALAGHDIMGSAQTGTGKTGAFSIPLIEKLLTNPQSAGLILTPTRELGKQIIDFIHQLLGPKSAIKTAFLIGGDPIHKQLKKLRAQPRLIVGTPGRINDHLERRTLDLSRTDFLVLDETDRMLDMGFTVQLERIFKYLPEERQTLMFSATLPPNILTLSKRYMDDPKRIAIGQTGAVAQNLKHDTLRVEQPKKYDALLGELHEREGSVIVFVKTKFGTERVAKRLRQDGFTADALHGDLKQSKRGKVMQNFRDQAFRILIATDIAARGLDVPHIAHVINHDLPQVAEDFIHRMGRTARAGSEGEAISFISGHEMRQWHAIDRLLNPGKPSTERPGGSSAPPRKKRKAPFNKGKKPQGYKQGQPRDTEGREHIKPRSKKPFKRSEKPGEYKDDKPSYAGKKPYKKDGPRTSGPSEHRGKKSSHKTGRRPETLEGEQPLRREKPKRSEGGRSEGRRPEGGRSEGRKSTPSKTLNGKAGAPKDRKFGSKKPTGPKKSFVPKRKKPV